MSQSNQEHVDDHWQGEETRVVDLPPPPPNDQQREIQNDEHHGNHQIEESPAVLMSNSAIFDQLALFGSTLSQVTTRMEVMERERPSRRAPDLDGRLPPTAPRRGELLGAHGNSGSRNRRPGKEPITEQGNFPGGGRHGRGFPDVTPRALTYGEDENRRNTGQRIGRFNADRSGENLRAEAESRRRAARRISPDVEIIDRAMSQRLERYQPRSEIYGMVPFRTEGARGNRSHRSISRPRRDIHVQNRERSYDTILNQKLSPRPQRHDASARERDFSGRARSQREEPRSFRKEPRGEDQNQGSRGVGILDQSKNLPLSTKAAIPIAPGFEDINIDALKKLLAQSEVQKETILDAVPSPFSPDVRQAPLPKSFRGIGDLRFTGNSDPAEFLGRFSTEMEVYQVQDLTKCRILASTLRGNAHQWFQKLSPASISSWEQMQGGRNPPGLFQKVQCGSSNCPRSVR